MSELMKSPIRLSSFEDIGRKSKKTEKLVKWTSAAGEPIAYCWASMDAFTAFYFSEWEEN